MGREAAVFYRQLADLLTSKHGLTYSITLSWVRCVLAFLVAVCYWAAISSSSGPLLPQLKWAWP